jgi:hypothetical protein
LAGVLTALAGCLPFGDGLPDLVLSSPAQRPPAGPKFYEAEPNDQFIRANLVGMDAGVQLIGTIGAGGLDFDVYDLGPADAGDRIQADLAAGGKDVQLGIYNEDQQLLSMVDATGQSSGAARIDFVLREPVTQLFAVAATRTESTSSRPYTINLTIEPNYGIPAFVPQVVVLNFKGAANVRIGRQPAVNVPPFDAATIDSRFAGQTQTLIAKILAEVRQDYAGLDVDFYLAGDPNLPAGDLTVLHFGSYSDRYLGLADNVDPFNRDTTQAAIIYTDTFSLFDVLSPSLDQMAQVLANVTSHELGHLLGLRHTADTRDLMDTTASARQMLYDQWFSIADLHPSVMAIGTQNAPAILAWTVGGTPPVPPAARIAKLQRDERTADSGQDFYIPRSWLATHPVEDDATAEDDPQGN